MQHAKKLSTLAFGAGTLCLAACGADAHGVDGRGQALTAECADASAELPADAWLCPDARTVECGSVDQVLYVRPTEDLSCEGSLSVSQEGPFAIGEHTIAVRNGDGETLCEAPLTVVDTQAPALTSHTLSLWPPNHKFHTISVQDCVSATDACQGEVVGEFLWASSDEPENGKGDGNHAPDILLGEDCTTVQLRAERAGPKNGRVYRLGVRVVDAAGNTSEGECAVIVDHDQRGVQGQDDGESYRITFDGSNGGPVCDGVGEPPAGDGEADGSDGDGEADGSDGENPAPV